MQFMMKFSSFYDVHLLQNLILVLSKTFIANFLEFIKISPYFVANELKVKIIKV
jgi:RAB protein geranylgeranyltransferase component A